MGFRNFACTLVLTFSFAGTAFGADAAAVPQTLSADMVTAASNEAVPLTDWTCMTRSPMKLTVQDLCSPLSAAATTVIHHWKATPFSDFAEATPLSWTHRNQKTTIRA